MSETERTLLEGVPEEAIPPSDGMGPGEPTLEDTSKEAVPPVVAPPQAEPSVDETIEHGWGEPTETRRHQTAPRPAVVPPPPPQQQPAPAVGRAAPRKARSPLPAFAGAISALAVIAVAGVLALSVINQPVAGLDPTSESLDGTIVAEVTGTPVQQATPASTQGVESGDDGGTTGDAGENPIDPAEVAVKTAVQRFDVVRLDALQTYDVQEVADVSIEQAQRDLFAEVSNLQQNECIWTFEDRGLTIERIDFAADDVTATAVGVADRGGVLECNGKVADQVDGPLRFLYSLRLVEGRWIVTDFIDESRRQQ